MSLYKDEKLLYMKQKWKSENCLVFKDLYHIYKDRQVETIALDGFSLEVKEGEFIAIMGPSGSGKTTFIKLLVGLILPSIGSIFFRSKDGSIIDLTNVEYDQLIDFRLKKIGYIQQKVGLFNNLNAYENILLPKLLILDKTGVGNDEKSINKLHEDADELLQYIGINERKYHYPSQMSGGEQQRVAIAAALLKKPELIIADEPTGELDAENTHRIFKLFKKISKEKGITVICVTHNVIVKQYADRIENIVDGKIFDSENSRGTA